MARIALLATITANEGSESEVEEAFKQAVARVGDEPGTLVYALHRKADDPRSFVFFEVYESNEAADAHRAGEALKELGPKLAGKVAGRPEITRLDPVAAKGLPG